MRHLATDPDVYVRTTYAKGLVRIAGAAVTMLEMSQAAKIPKAELEASGMVEVGFLSRPEARLTLSARLRLDAA